MERKFYTPRERKEGKSFFKKAKPFGEKKEFKRKDDFKPKGDFTYGKKEFSKFKKSDKPTIRRVDNDKICVVAAFHSPTFSGRVGSELLRALKESGLKVSASDRSTYLTQNGFSYGSDIETILELPEYEETKVWVADINDIPEKIYGGKNFIVTTFNAANAELKQLSKLKQAKHVWVPSEKHISACIKAGINKLNLSVFQIPIVKAFNKMAVRPAELAKKSGVFRFIVSGSPTYKNGIEDVLKAYITEFNPGEKVELVIKLTHYPNLKKRLSFEIGEMKKRFGALNDMFAKVTIVSHTLRDEEYAGLIASADAYVTAEKVSNSSLGIKEAMACNLAVVAPKWLVDNVKASGEGVYSVEYVDSCLEVGKLYADSPKQSVKQVDCDKLAKVMRKAFDDKKHCKMSDNSDCSKLAFEIGAAIKRR